MSNSAGEETSSSAEQAWVELEAAVRRLLDDHAETARRLRVAEAKTAELEQTLHAVSAGDLNPREMSEELERLKDRNSELHRRLAQGREKVEGVIQRIELIESERR